jgi:hypothetical protein
MEHSAATAVTMTSRTVQWCSPIPARADAQIPAGRRLEEDTNSVRSLGMKGALPHVGVQQAAGQRQSLDSQSDDWHGVTFRSGGLCAG